jgi:molybdopterin-binding protein
VRLSARNQLNGTVRSVELGAVMAVFIKATEVLLGVE